MSEIRGAGWTIRVVGATVIAALLPSSVAGRTQLGSSADARKVIVSATNDLECKVKTVTMGEGLPSKGKKLNIKPGKSKNLRLKGPGTEYTWTATSSCCADGAGAFDAPLTRKGNAPLVFSCGPPIETPFAVASDDIVEGATIPTEHTCEGTDVSPELEIANVPSGTLSFVMIMDDPDAPVGTFTHWVLFDIPAGQSSLPGGFLPGDFGVSGRNDFGTTAYEGPCPPRGDGEHRYFFTLYSLDIETLNLPADSTRTAVEQAMAGHVISQTELMGVFERS